MTEKLSIDIVRFWCKMATGDYHYTKVLDGQVDPLSYPQLRKIMHDLVKERGIKPSGNHDGIYRTIKEVKSVRWQEADETKYFDLIYPMGHGGDESCFGFEDLISLSEGDLIVIGGVSNAGKSAVVLNLLGENIDKHECILMGNEYTTLDGKPSPKFKRRMMRMDWADWMDGDGNAKFELLPIRENFEDYIQAGKLNMIDWINLTDQFYKIGKILEDGKVAVGDGLLVAVLQKGEGVDLARGKDFTKDLADLYITIDFYGETESRLTVGKVKEPKARITGRSWAFRIVDSGANLHNIREIRKCYACWGRGYTKQGRCDKCIGKGYIEIEEV